MEKREKEPKNHAKLGKKPPKKLKTAEKSVEIPENPCETREKSTAIGIDFTQLPEVSALRPKWKAFVIEYMADLNATEAAKRCGYSRNSAMHIGSQLSARPLIKEAIASCMRARSIRSSITADRVLEEIARMAFYDPAALVTGGIKCPEDIAKLPEDTRRAVIGWSWDKSGNFIIKLSPKTPSLELLGRHLAMFTDKSKVEGDLNLEHSGKLSLHILDFAGFQETVGASEDSPE